MVAPGGAVLGGGFPAIRVVARRLLRLHRHDRRGGGWTVARDRRAVPCAAPSGTNGADVAPESRRRLPLDRRERSNRWMRSAVGNRARHILPARRRKAGRCGAPPRVDLPAGAPNSIARWLPAVR